MNECLTTPQHKSKIGYLVSNKWYLHKQLKYIVYIKHSQGYYKHSVKSFAGIDIN